MAAVIIKSCLLTLVLGLGLTCVAKAQQGKSLSDPLPVCTLSNDRAKYDQKVWYVRGVITSFKNRKGPTGRPYVVVQLKDAGGGNCWVRLYSRHRWLVNSGQTITVLGKYFKAFRYFRYTYKHEIQPTMVHLGNCELRLTGNGWRCSSACRNLPFVGRCHPGNP